MDLENRAGRDKQLREPEPGGFPVEDSEVSLAGGGAGSPARPEIAQAEEEAELTGAAMAVRPLSGSFQASTPVNSGEALSAPRRVETAAQNENNREEEALVQRILAGETEAFAGLVDRYKVAVYNLCARMLNDPTEAEDAAQEVFVRAYTQLHSYQPGRRFSTWILSIASHYCIDMLRRRKPSVDIDTIAFWKQSDQPEPEERALTVETRDEVRELLNKLPDKYRGVTVLRYWNDLSYDEIAETTGLSVATVKTRLFRARELLAKELEKQRQNGNSLEPDKKPRPRGLFKRNRTVNSNAD